MQTADHQIIRENSKVDKGEEKKTLTSSGYKTDNWFWNRNHSSQNTSRASLVAQTVKNLPLMWETWVWSLDQEDPLKKVVATHSSILPGKLHRQRSLAGYSPWGHKELDTTEWLTHTHTHTHTVEWHSKVLKDRKKEKGREKKEGRKKKGGKLPIHNFKSSENIPQKVKWSKDVWRNKWYIIKRTTIKTLVKEVLQIEGKLLEMWAQIFRKYNKEHFKSSKYIFLLKLYGTVNKIDILDNKTPLNQYQMIKNSMMYLLWW